MAVGYACAASGVLILDEVKSGMGKSCKMFVCQFGRAEPDLLLVGKSIGVDVMRIGLVRAKRIWWTKYDLNFRMISSSAASN